MASAAERRIYDNKWCPVEASVLSQSQTSDWVCGTCTLSNDPEAPECSACGAPRSEQLRTTKRICAICTFENPYAVTTCTICEGDLSSQVAEEGTGSSTWSCVDCTFVNNLVARSCGCCGMLVNEGKKRLLNDSWSCEICTFENASANTEVCFVQKTRFYLMCLLTSTTV